MVFINEMSKQGKRVIYVSMQIHMACIAWYQAELVIFHGSDGDVKCPTQIEMLDVQF